MISRKGTRRSGAASGDAKIFREEGSGPVVTAGTVLSGLERMFMGILLNSLVSLRERQSLLSSPRKRGSSIAEGVVRCGEAAAYWIARSSRAMTVECVERTRRITRPPQKGRAAARWREHRAFSWAGRCSRHPEARALARLEGWTSRAVALRGPLARPPWGDGVERGRGASSCCLHRQVVPLPFPR